MKKIIPFKFAIYCIITILSIIIVFHLLVLFRIIPHDIVWGGRLKDVSQMLRYETSSIIINLLMIIIVAVKGDILKWKTNKSIITILLWIMAGFFLLNTIGNLYAKNGLETIIFAPLTFILSILSFRLALPNNR